MKQIGITINTKTLDWKKSATYVCPLSLTYIFEFRAMHNREYWLEARTAAPVIDPDTWRMMEYSSWQVQEVGREHKHITPRIWMDKIVSTLTGKNIYASEPVIIWVRLSLLPITPIGSNETQ